MCSCSNETNSSNNILYRQTHQCRSSHGVGPHSALHAPTKWPTGAKGLDDVCSDSVTYTSTTWPVGTNLNGFTGTGRTISGKKLKRRASRVRAGGVKLLSESSWRVRVKTASVAGSPRPGCRSFRIVKTKQKKTKTQKSWIVSAPPCYRPSRLALSGDTFFSVLFLYPLQRSFNPKAVGAFRTR